MTEEIIDEIYELTNAVPTRAALEALTACIMGTVERCPDPSRALLAVIAELTTLVRFAEGSDQDNKALSLEL
jgi:hypothetical protein